jgi:hypothetical protein
MPILAAVLFLSGMTVLLVGAARAAFAIHALWRQHGGSLPSLRHALPPAAWLSLSVYGLVLASAGMLLAR